MHKETKATAIPASVKAAVFERDGGSCILCGKPGAPHCHVIRRSSGGLGVKQNIVTLCSRCHYAFDEGRFLKSMPPGLQSREEIKTFIYAYMERHYLGWTPESVTYHKRNMGKSKGEYRYD